MKLGLGTAQFGFAYGLTNRHGQVPIEEAARILATLAPGTPIDTAAGYGEAETVLGKLLPKPNPHAIISKIGRLVGEETLPHHLSDRVAGQIEAICRRLGQTHLYGLLLHCPSDLLGPEGDGVYRTIDALRDRYGIRKIGVSVYTPEEADCLVARYGIDLIQLPLNLLDQRHHQQGTLVRLKQKGVEIHVRSAFLQGVLLSPAASLPGFLADLTQPLSQLAALSQASGLSKAALCLGFLRRLGTVDAAICGVGALTQWLDLQAALLAEKLPELSQFEALAVVDKASTDPRTWPPRPA